MAEMKEIIEEPHIEPRPKVEADVELATDIKPSSEIQSCAVSFKSTGDTLQENGNDNDDLEAVASAVSHSEPIYSVFSPGMRKFIVAMAIMSSLFSPLSSFIYLPAIDTLSSYYGETVAKINLSITTYQVLQGLSPMFYGNMADTIGRRPVYVLTFTVYLAANLGLALQNSYGALMALRALQSAGSSATIALGNAVVADIATTAERAAWMGYVSAGIMLGPAIAPVLGGLITQFANWRWIFWFLFILNVVYLALYVIINPETCRNVVDDGSLPPPKINKSVVQLITDARKKARGVEPDALSPAQEQKVAELKVKRGKFRFPNPVASLRCIIEPDVALVMAYQAVLVSVFYCIMVPITPVFSSTYGFNELQIGLCYIPFAAGSAAGSIGGGKFLNWNFNRTARRLGLKVDRKRASQLREFPIERARLGYIFVPNAIVGVGLLCWGWVLEQRTSLAAPLIFLIITSLGATSSTVMVNTLLVDLYPHAPATVVAANNLVRCLVASAASAVIQYIIDALGLGWCYTLLAAITVLSSGFLYIDLKFGPKWREQRVLKVERQKAEELQKEEAEKRASTTEKQ